MPDQSQTKILILTVGLPRSGKSTWDRQQGVPIVCPDEIRLALHGQPFVEAAEPFVWAIAQVMIKALFSAGHSVVVLDACNTTRKRRDEWISDQWVRQFQSFPASAEECSARTAGNEALIPVIQRMAERQEPIAPDELSSPG